MTLREIAERAMYRACPVCGVIWRIPLTRQKRRDFICKPCANARMNKWRENKKARLAIKCREWKSKNPEKLNTYKLNRKNWLSYNQEIRSTHKERARFDARNAVRRGDIKRMPRERCGALNTESHHPDYSRSLEIKWLCTPCHGIEHRIYP